VGRVERVHNTLNSTVFSKHPAVFPPDVFNAELTKYAILLRDARCFSRYRMAGLIPLADMLNHQAKSDFDYVGNVISGMPVYSREQFKAGDEMFDTYITGPNYKFVTH
jgi:hypothetical protein